MKFLSKNTQNDFNKIFFDQLIILKTVFSYNVSDPKKIFSSCSDKIHNKNERDIVKNYNLPKLKTALASKLYKFINRSAGFS